MIIQTLPNKSVVVMSDMPHEGDIVASFRQFAIGDRVKIMGKQYTLLDVATVVFDDKMIRNVYVYFKRSDGYVFEISEPNLLQENPRPVPSNIFDTLADIMSMKVGE